MKAIFYEKYGPPDVLELREVEKPTPKDDEVLVEVRAAGLNAYDWHALTADIFLLRLMGFGLLKPKYKILGADIAGRVEAVGGKVTQFRPGDDVFGDISHGGFAEYACARENRLAPKPSNLTFEEAAAVPIAALTALQGLRDKGRIQPGQKVLINGASGGVGTFAVQMAKAFGAEVTAVCSTGKMDQARALGADHALDYTKEDFTKGGLRYDLIYDVVGDHSTSAYKRTLNPGGICVLVGFGFPRLSWSKLIGHLLFDPIRSRVSDKKVRFMGIAKFNVEVLGTLAELMASGKVVPAVERTYPLGQMAEAMRYFGQGHAQAKVVITVGH